VRADEKMTAFLELEGATLVATSSHLEHGEWRDK
jgi:hypothetical protein